MLTVFSKYAVVEFIEEICDGEVPMAVVSDYWLEKGTDADNFENYCYWPSYIRESYKINKLTLEHASLDKNRCARCPINIKFSSGKYFYSEIQNFNKI